MGPFLFSLFIIAVFIVCVSMATNLEKIEKNKKEEFLVSDKMLSEDEKQKIRDEDYIDLYTKLKNKEKIYITSNGTVLNSEPHTFKDFIDNQKLPSKLELIWEILADNDVKIEDITREIEDNGPFPPDTQYYLLPKTLNVTPEQVKMIYAIHFNYGNPLLIDNKYPLYIIFNELNVFSGRIHVFYQAGYKSNDGSRTRRGAPTKPTKY